MPQKPKLSFFYTGLRLFWSIYFVLTIAMVGFVGAYIFVMLLFSLSFLTQKIDSLSKFFLYTAEYVQCFFIRFLLKIQPWLNLEHNFQGIYGFFDRYQTRRVVFVGNHRSNLDTFVLISLIPGLRGLAKRSLFYNIFFAPIMLLAGFIPAAKGDLNNFRSGLQKLKKRVLEKNRAVLIFPETTRCPKNFASIGKFSLSTLEIAMESRALVVPILIRGTDDLMGRGDVLLNPGVQVKLQIMDPIDPQKFSNVTALSKYVWETLAQAQSCN